MFIYFLNRYLLTTQYTLELSLAIPFSVLGLQRTQVLCPKWRHKHLWKKEKVLQKKVVNKEADKCRLLCLTLWGELKSIGLLEHRSSKSCCDAGKRSSPDRCTYHELGFPSLQSVVFSYGNRKRANTGNKLLKSWFDSINKTLKMVNPVLEKSNLRTRITLLCSYCRYITISTFYSSHSSEILILWEMAFSLNLFQDTFWPGREMSAFWWLKI